MPIAGVSREPIVGDYGSLALTLPAQQKHVTANLCVPRTTGKHIHARISVQGPRLCMFRMALHRVDLVPVWHTGIK